MGKARAAKTLPTLGKRGIVINNILIYRYLLFKFWAFAKQNVLFAKHITKKIYSMMCLFSNKISNFASANPSLAKSCIIFSGKSP